MTKSVSTSPLASLTFEQLLAAVSAPEPAPGGGSVAALTGALGSALVQMVIGLASRRGDAAHAEELHRLEERAGRTRQALVDLAEADAEVYQRVIAAFQMPRSTEEEVAVRTGTIEMSLHGACETPLRAAAQCVEALELARLAVGYATRDTTSDALSGAFLAHAALQAAAISVRTNLRRVRDDSFRASTAARVAELMLAGEAALAGTLAAAEKASPA